MERIAEVTKNLRKVFLLNYNPGDKVLIVADTQTDPVIRIGLMAAANEFGIEPTVVIENSSETHIHEPSEILAEALKKADLIISIVKNALLYSNGMREAYKYRNSQNRLVMMDQGLNLDMLYKGPGNADYDKMNVLGEKVKEAWDNGKEVKVYCANGTNLKAIIDGRKSWLITGKAFLLGLMNVCAFPDGECGIVPVEGTAKGKIVYDGSFHHVGKLRDNIEVTVENGWAIDVTGGSQADELVRYLKEKGDENSFNCPAEISIGLNEKCPTISGNMRMDKKKKGAVHIALGDCSIPGGAISSKLHLDGVITYPSVEIDNKLIVDKGNIIL